jgi:hypothetical protein
MSSKSYFIFIFVALVSLMGLPLVAWKVSSSVRKAGELGRGGPEVIDSDQKALK